MSEARLYSFKGTIFEKENPGDFTFLKSMSKGFFEKLTKEFLIFSDFYYFDKYASVIAELKSNTNFKGIILSIDRDMFTLSQRTLALELTTPIIKRMATVEDFNVIKRFIHAWKVGGQNDLIADFKVNHHNQYYLMDCGFNLIRGDLKDIDLFKDSSPDDLRNFSIDPNGNYVHWGHKDYHLDLDFFKAEQDPEYKDKLILKGIEKNKDFGRIMKIFREAKEVTQGSFEGLSDKQIRRYENGEMYPTYKSLTAIAKRFDLNVTQYIAALDEVGARLNEEETSEQADVPAEVG